MPEVSVLVWVLDVVPPLTAAGVDAPDVFVPPLVAPPELVAVAAPLVAAPPVAPPEVDAPDVAAPDVTGPVVALPPAPDVATRLAAPPVCETCPFDITAPIGLLIDKPFVEPADAPALEMVSVVEPWFASPLVAVVLPELVSVPPVAAPPVDAPLVAEPPVPPVPPVAVEVVGPDSVAVVA